MATSLSLENDSSLSQGYIKVNGTTAATITTSGITGNLTGNVTGNADTATKLSTTTGSAPAYACRAWVNFSGVGSIGSNMTIRSSGNVANVNKSGTGTYVVNLVNPMTDTNYSVSAIFQRISTWIDSGIQALPTTASSITIQTVENNVFVDPNYVHLQIFGN